jgi:hypothetical protein
VRNTRPEIKCVFILDVGIEWYLDGNFFSSHVGFLCFQVPDHLEPGLDDKQLTRLLGLDLQGAEQTHDPPERPRKRSGLTDISPEEVQQHLEKQKDSSKWHGLVEGNLILKQGLVDKRKVRPQMNASTLLCMI